MAQQDDLSELLEMFQVGSGFGDPDARRNAELRLQAILAKQQQQTAHRLNILTLCLVAVGLLQVIVLIAQIFR